MDLGERLALNADLAAGGLATDPTAEAEAATRRSARLTLCTSCPRLRGVDPIGPYCAVAVECCGSYAPGNVDLAAGICTQGRW